MQDGNPGPPSAGKWSGMSGGKGIGMNRATFTLKQEAGYWPE